MIMKHWKTAKTFKISSLYAELTRLEFETANVEKRIALYLWRVHEGIKAYRKIIFIIFHWHWTSLSRERPYKHYQDYLTYSWLVLAQLIAPPHNQHCVIICIHQFFNFLPKILEKKKCSKNIKPIVTRWIKGSLNKIYLKK